MSDTTVNISVHHAETGDTFGMQSDAAGALADIVAAIAAGDAVEASLDDSIPEYDTYSITVTSEYGRRATYSFDR